MEDERKKEKRRWVQKIKELFDHPDIEKKIITEYCKNSNTRKCLLWKIEAMSYSAEDLIKLYDQCTIVVAQSVDRSIQKRLATEEAKKGKLKEKRGW